MIDWFRGRPKLSIVLGILAGIVLLLVFLALKPFSLNATIVSQPAESYAEALVRIEDIQKIEAGLSDLSAECGSILMTEGEKNLSQLLHLWSNAHSSISTGW